MLPEVDGALHLDSGLLGNYVMVGNRFGSWNMMAPVDGLGIFGGSFWRL